MQSGQAASIGVGISPAGVLADVYTAGTGEDYFTDEEVTGFWRWAGIVPGVSELRKGGKVLDAARAVPRLRGPIFDDLAGHAARHGAAHPNAYYNAAVRHLESGTRFTFRHDDQFKNAFITRTGPDSFTFTSASRTGDRIFTHIDDVTTQYLRNIGITLPRGF